MKSIFARQLYLDRVYDALQYNYVALLGQRGTGLQTFLDTLTSSSPSNNMQFLSITMPEHVADDENLFNHALLANLLEKIRYLPSGESLCTDIKQSIEKYEVMEEASIRLWLAFERLGRKTSARPLVIVLQAFADLPSKQLNKFLLALRDYHRQINGQGEAGRHLRFLVAGDLRLWLLSFYKGDDMPSPFDYATRIFFDGLSYQELAALHPSSDIKRAIYVKNLTDGIPNFVEKVGQLKSSSNTLRPFFSLLEKRWNRLSEQSQQALKKFAENPDHIIDYNPDYACLQIPKLSPPWLEAFWQGFLRVRLRKITWRSPVHRAFVLDQLASGTRAISKSTMMRIHQVEGLRHFTQLINHILEEENLANYLDDALLLTFSLPGSLLAPLVYELCSGRDREEMITQIRALVTNTNKYWLKLLLEDFDAEYDEEYFEYFLVSASMWEARRILEDFDTHFYYDDTDISTVTYIAKQLLANGILPWLDSWEIPPGQHEQFSSVAYSRHLTVFLGKDSTEMAYMAKLEEFLSLHHQHIDIVIVVILADAPKHLQLPAVLSKAKRIDGRKRDASLLQQLKAAITETHSSGKPTPILLEQEPATQVLKKRPDSQSPGNISKEVPMVDETNINDVQKTAITNELAKIIRNHAISSPMDQKEFFRALVQSVPMPNQWKGEIIGAWTADIKFNAERLITWAWSKGSVKSNPPPEFTLLGSLLYNFLENYIGRDDEARIVAAVIVSYSLCLNEELRNKIAIQYRIPQIMHPGKQIVRYDDMAWRGPAPENDIELQTSLPRKFPRIEMEYLKGAVEQADVVCRIELANKGRQGTGFLIARNLVLTNYHILKVNDDEDIYANAREATLLFGYTKQGSGQSFKLVEEEPILRSSPKEELDFVLLQVEEKIINAEGIKVARYSLKSLNQGMGMNIIQHPNGETMQIAMSGNGIIGVYDKTNLVQYVNSTIGGSSGAPCFNEDWEVVALHHAEKPRMFGVIGEGIVFSAIHKIIHDKLLSHT